MIAGNPAGKEAVSLTKGEKNPVSPGAEQRVAAFFAARGAGILQMPLSEIASACGVSDAAVVRHCRREGYRGLKDYKIAKANEQQADLSAPPVRGDESLPELKRRIFAGCIRAMKETSDQLNAAEMERAIRAIADSANLDVYACGGSVPVASYLRHQLIKLGIRTSVYSDRSSMLLSQSRLSQRDAVIAISSSGVTRDVVDAQRGARSAGAVTICLTAGPESPLAGTSDILLIATGESFLGSNTYSRLSQIAVVDVLYAGLKRMIG